MAQGQEIVSDLVFSGSVFCKAVYLRGEIYDKHGNNFLGTFCRGYGDVGSRCLDYVRHRRDSDLARSEKGL